MIFDYPISNMTTVPAYRPNKPIAPYPIQLAAKSSKFNTFDEIYWYNKEQSTLAQQQLELEYQ